MSHCLFLSTFASRRPLHWDLLIIVLVKAPGGEGGGRTDHILNITEEVHGPALIKEGFI